MNRGMERDGERESTHSHAAARIARLGTKSGQSGNTRKIGAKVTERVLQTDHVDFIVFILNVLD